MRARYVLPNFRIAVVGAGAIAGYYGMKLAYFGRDVHFLMRGDLSEVRRFGIRIKGKAENIRLAKVQSYATTAPASCHRGRGDAAAEKTLRAA